MPYNRFIVKKVLKSGFLIVSGTGATIAVTGGVEAVLESEHYRSTGREILLDKFHRVVVHHGIVAGCVEQVFCLKGDTESVVEESLVNLGIDVPGSIRQFHIIFPRMCHQLCVDIKPDVEREVNGILPLEQKPGSIHFHRLAVDRQREPLLHHADIHARRPYSDFELTADKCLKIMAVIKIGSADDGCLSIRAVRLCDVIYTVLEIYI